MKLNFIVYFLPFLNAKIDGHCFGILHVIMYLNFFSIPKYNEYSFWSTLSEKKNLANKSWTHIRF